MRSPALPVIRTWIQQHNLTCPLCRSSAWDIGAACDLPDRSGSGNGFPVVPLVCAGCAFTALLAADRVLGSAPPAGAPGPP